MKTDGSAAAGTLIPAGDTIRIPWSFDDDGSHLAFYQRGTRGTGSVTFDLWTVPVTIGRDSMTAGKPQPFLVSDSFEVYPAFSPDGRWIAYTSLESGAYEIYVRAFPDGGHKRQISTHGGTVAAWARDGRRLFYQTADQRIMVVDWSVSDGVSQPAQPRFWTDTRLADVRSRSELRCCARRAGCGADRTAIGKPAACESGHVGVELVPGIAPPRAPVNGQTGAHTLSVSVTADRFPRRGGGIAPHCCRGCRSSVRASETPQRRSPGFPSQPDRESRSRT